MDSEPKNNQIDKNLRPLDILIRNTQKRRTHNKENKENIRKILENSEKLNFKKITVFTKTVNKSQSYSNLIKPTSFDREFNKKCINLIDKIRNNFDLDMKSFVKVNHKSQVQIENHEDFDSVKEIKCLSKFLEKYLEKNRNKMQSNIVESKKPFESLKEINQIVQNEEEKKFMNFKEKNKQRISIYQKYFDISKKCLQDITMNLNLRNSKGNSKDKNDLNNSNQQGINEIKGKSFHEFFIFENIMKKLQSDKNGLHNVLSQFSQNGGFESTLVDNSHPLSERKQVDTINKENSVEKNIIDHFTENLTVDLRSGIKKENKFNVIELKDNEFNTKNTNKNQLSSFKMNKSLKLKKESFQKIIQETKINYEDVQNPNSSRYSQKSNKSNANSQKMKNYSLSLKNSVVNNKISNKNEKTQKKVSTNYKSQETSTNQNIPTNTFYNCKNDSFSLSFSSEINMNNSQIIVTNQKNQKIKKANYHNYKKNVFKNLRISKETICFEPSRIKLVSQKKNVDFNENAHSIYYDSLENELNENLEVNKVHYSPDIKSKTLHENLTNLKNPSHSTDTGEINDPLKLDFEFKAFENHYKNKIYSKESKIGDDLTVEFHKNLIKNKSKDIKIITAKAFINAKDFFETQGVEIEESPSTFRTKLHDKDITNIKEKCLIL